MREVVLFVAGGVFLALLALRLYAGRRSRWRVVGRRGETTLIVRMRGGLRELVLVEGQRELVQSRQDPDRPLSSGPGYIDGLHIGMLLAPRPRRVVFLGGGACIGPRQFEAEYADVLLDVVEHDPLVLDAARRHFGLRASPRLSLIEADALTFMKGCRPGSYDLVVLDAYDARQVPRHLTTAKFFEDVGAAMTPEGSLVVNLIGDLGSDEGSARSILASLEEVFPSREIALFDATGTSDRNAIALIAPAVGSTDSLVARAAAIAVAPGLAAIVRRRLR